MGLFSRFNKGENAASDIVGDSSISGTAPKVDSNSDTKTKEKKLNNDLSNVQVKYPAEDDYDDSDEEVEGSTLMSNKGMTAAMPAVMLLPENMPTRLETIEELTTGNPDEVIQVPMIMTVRTKSVGGLFRSSKAQQETDRRVVLRSMTRAAYAARYAKNASGEYIGTGPPAVDAGLVFVPGQQSDRLNLDRQVKGVAFGKEHDVLYYGDPRAVA